MTDERRTAERDAPRHEPDPRPPAGSTGLLVLLVGLRPCVAAGQLAVCGPLQVGNRLLLEDGHRQRGAVLPSEYVVVDVLHHPRLLSPPQTEPHVFATVRVVPL